MDLDRRTLNLAAAGLCGIGSVIGLLSTLFGRNRGSAVLPSLLATVGSAAWVMSALQDVQEADQPA